MHTTPLLRELNILTQLNSAYQKYFIGYNEQVTNNCYVLKLIICCIKFCSAFELALKGHSENEESGNYRICREVVNSSEELDIVLSEHL